jgi:lysophospholipase L1-like esterase
MFDQAQDLVNRMKDSKEIDFKNSWKLITFFIGGNDLCKSCKDEDKFTPNNYINNLRKTLGYFKENLPRAFINLVLTLDVSGLCLIL